MKYSKSISILLTSFSFLFISCEKENSKEIEPISTPFYLYHKYLLVDVQANFPIDLNFDGIENVDLTKEIDVLRDCFIYFTDKEITVAWPEAQVDQYPLLTSEIPIIYIGQDVKYFIIQNYYTYSVSYRNNDTYARVYPKEIREEVPRNYFGLTPPTRMEVYKEQNTITFSYAHQNFMTKEGIKVRQFTAVFTPDPADNYFQ